MGFERIFRYDLNRDIEELVFLKHNGENRWYYVSYEVGKKADQNNEQNYFAVI